MQYHEQIVDKFGATGRIESAIRTVATYKVGVRCIAQIPSNKLEEYRTYMEQIYKDILKEE